MRRWFSGDERTLAVFLVGGVLTIAFFRLELLRGYLGITTPGTLLLVGTAIAWWSLLPRSFVWLDPADLTWRDFGALDRVSLIRRRLTTGWLVRLLALGYLLALLAALTRAPVLWVVASASVLAGAALLAFAVVRRPRTVPTVEALVVLAVATVAPDPATQLVLAAGMATAGLALVRGGPSVTDVTRPVLVDGWRERVLRVSGVQFLDLALMLPAARPTRPHALTSTHRLAWLGVAGRLRHLPTAVLLGIAAVAAHRTLPTLPDALVFGLFGYLALLPLTAGLGELWRSPGRRRWVGATDTALRWHHLLVATTLGVTWGLPVCLLGGWSPTVLAAIPVVAACAVRTMTRKAPTYDNLVPVDTGMGTMPIRLVMQTLRGPEVGVLAWVLTYGMPPVGVAVVVAAVVALALFR